MVMAVLEITHLELYIEINTKDLDNTLSYESGHYSSVLQLLLFIFVLLWSEFMFIPALL